MISQLSGQGCEMSLDMIRVVSDMPRADELKRRNAELERELQEIKNISPSSAASASDWSFWSA